MHNNMQANSKSWYMLESYWHNTAFAALLSFWAGNYNSLSSISLLFDRSSHVSGRIADIGIELVFMPIGVIFTTLIWISFVIGSFLAGLFLPKLGLTKALIIQSLYILLAALVAALGVEARSPSAYGLGKGVMAFMLPLAMGFQNSITTQLPLDRTTHWTGSSTDLGIAIANQSWALVIFTSIKIFSFITGAALMAGLVGIANITPHNGLLLISIGLMITTVIGDKIDKRVFAQKNNKE